MPYQWETKDLFGGAITARLPNSFMDVSDLRQVPDNQEVFVDRTGVDSIVVDIMERVDGDMGNNRLVTSDDDAIKFHAEDIVESANPIITDTNLVTLPNLTAQQPCLTCFVSSATTGENEYTGILLLLIRLIEHKTDILVSVNLPNLSVSKDVMSMSQEQPSQRLQDARLIMSEIIGSFHVKNWGLFV